MTVYRLSKAAFKNDLSGKGAEKAGGRWNSKGVALVYTAESRSLCTAEIAVHTPLGIVPKDYFLVTIEIPDNLSIGVVDSKSLPRDWKSFPHPNSTQQLGDRFVAEGRHIALKVPSAVVAGDFNYVINPAHPQIGKVKIVNTEPYEFDRRLFVKS